MEPARPTRPAGTAKLAGIVPTGSDTCLPTDGPQASQDAEDPSQNEWTTARCGEAAPEPNGRSPTDWWSANGCVAAGTHLPAQAGLSRPPMIQLLDVQWMLQRTVPASGAAAAILVLGASLCGCARSTPTSPPPPTGTPSATSAISPTATNAASATTIPTPTDMPGPIAVAVPLAEAERDVLSWLDPTREPRIEWSKYVRRRELGEAIEANGHMFLLDMWPGLFEHVPLSTLSELLIVVVGSTRGIDPLSAPGKEGEPWLQRQAQPVAVSPDRQLVVAVFDALTGERLAAVPALGGEFLDTLGSLRSLDVHVRPDARRTLTPWPTWPPSVTPAAATATPFPPINTPTSVPDVARLTWSNLPAELRPTFRAYPLAPGSSLTWRYTMENGGVRWVAAVLTESIEAAWLEHDLAVVRSRVDTLSLTPARNRDDHWLSRPPTTTLRYVTPGRIVASRADLKLAENFAIPTPGANEPFGRDGLALEFFVSLLPIPSLIGSTKVGRGPVNVATTAGTFSDCWEIETQGGASWGSVRWFCPGVGTVQYGFGDSALGHRSTAIADLIRWRRTTLPER